MPPATTPNGWTYLLPSDHPLEYPAATQQQAQKLDVGDPWAQLTGSVTPTASAWAQFTALTVTPGPGSAISGVGPITVPAGKYLITARMKTAGAGRMILGADNGDGSYTSKVLFDLYTQPQFQIPAGNILLASTGSIRFWGWLSAASALTLTAEIVRVAP